MERQPNSDLWREIYVGVGGVFARLVDDAVLGRSLVVSLPRYECNQENVVVGLKNLEEGNPRSIDDWLSRYTGREHGGAREDGVIVTPLKLETAVAECMYSIRDVSLFAAEVEAYRTSFQEEVESAWPAYGKFTYQRGGTRATLDELTLDGKRVPRTVDVPVLQGGYAVLAPAQAEDAYALAEIAPDVERCVEGIAGSKNPANVFQYWSSRRNTSKRETRLWNPNQNSRRQRPERALVLGRDLDDNRFIIDCGGIVWPARGCRRAKNFLNSL